MRSSTMGSLATRALVMRSIVMKSERCKARVQHPPHLALRRPLRLGRTLAQGVTLVAARRTARLWLTMLRRLRVVEVFKLECPAKPLQLENQRRALRPDRTVIQRTGPARRHDFVFVRVIDNSHDGTPSLSVFA